MTIDHTRWPEMAASENILCFVHDVMMYFMHRCLLIGWV